MFHSPAVLIDPSDQGLPFNPTGEFIFPSVFHAAAHLPNPLAAWYLYFAPHDRPGGICLMYADSLDGPWTHHRANPLITNDWAPHYSVSHVSSPDVIWNAAEGRVFLYFHGENNVTRLATSADGLAFDYDREVITTAQVDAALPGQTATETSYARVFEHPDRGSPHRYGMFFMVNHTDNVRKIAVAFSPDGREWTVQPDLLVVPGAAEGDNVSSADLWVHNGTPTVIYGSSAGTIFARTLNRALTRAGDPRALYVPGTAAEAGRATAPQIVTDAGRTHLFYELGARAQTTIGHAVGTVSPARRWWNRLTAPGSQAGSARGAEA